MGKLNIFTGTLLKEIVESPINGEISVVKSLAFGTYIQVGNLTQSGGILEGIWNKTLKRVKKNNKSRIKKVLVLGLGGGSVAKIIRKYWPGSVITGVDIDPNMVGMGNKYLGLGEVEVDIVIEDAQKYLIQNTKYKGTKFDLICIDLYVGDMYPEKFESENFIKLIKNSLSSESIAVFNRLYYDEKRKQAMKFGEKLKKIFLRVDYVFPEANLMFVCRKF